MSDLLMFLPVCIPIITGVALVFLGKYPTAHRVIGIGGAIALLAAGIALLNAVITSGIQVVALGNWKAPYGITLVADHLAAVMVAITGMIGLAVCVYSLAGTAEKYRKKHYYALVHFLLAGVCGAFLAGDLFNLYVWFEVMLISSFVLLTLDGKREQLVGAVHYVTLNLVSSVIFLCGLGILYGKTGTLNMADLALKLSESPDSINILSSSVFFLVAFGIKAGVFPLFFWLPASYPTPPIAVAALFSGLLTKVGVYALIRSFTLIFTQDQAFTNGLLLLIAGCTMVFGVLGAAAQSNIRKILSFHIVSQIGYMVMGLALMTPLALAGAIFYLIHHIAVKTNLFLVAGLLEGRSENSDLGKLGGLLNSKPFFALLFLIPALSLAGVPPLSGFFSKLLLIKAGLDVSAIAIVVTALAVGVLTLISMTKIWQEAFWKPAPADAPDPNEASSTWRLIPVVCLALVTVAVGLGAGPVLDFSKEAADILLEPSNYIQAVLGGNAS